MIYDYKSENTVQDVIVDNIDELINDINSEYSNLRRGDIILIYVPSVIGKQIIGEILNNIVDVWVHTDSHNDLLYNGKNEVLISLASDGMVFVEEARSNFGTLVGLEGSVLSYVYDRFSKRDIDDLSYDGDSILVFGFDDDEGDSEWYTINGKTATKEEFNEYVSQFRKNDNKEKTPNELSSTAATYYVNGKQVGKATYDKAVSEIEDKYLDNMRNMLLGYCEFMDEINEWRKLFCW